MTRDIDLVIESMSMEEWIIHWGKPLDYGFYDHRLDGNVLKQLQNQYSFHKYEIHLYHLEGITYQFTNDIISSDQTQCFSHVIDQINLIPVPDTLTYHRVTNVSHNQSYPFQPINQYQTEVITRYVYHISHDMSIKVDHDEKLGTCDLQLICREPLFVRLLSIEQEQWRTLLKFPTIPEQVQAVIALLQ